MTVNELHYQFKLNMDRVDSLSKPDFNRAEIDFFLNEAQLVFIKQRMSALSNPKGKGFESTQKRIDDLSTLVVKYPAQSPIVPTDWGAFTYEVPFSALSQPYLQILNASVKMQTAPNCFKTFPLKYTQHDDFLESLRDPFNSPSLEFFPYNIGRSEVNTSSSALYFYTIPGYTPVEVQIEYIKYPSRISYGSYTYIDGINYPAATSELPPHTHNELVDIATQIAALNIEDPNLVQLKNLKIQVHE